MGLESAALAGRAGDKYVRKELHRNFLVAHTAATFAAASSRIEGKCGSRETGGLGFLGGGVQLAHEIVNIEVEQGSGPWGLREGGLVDQKDIGDRFITRKRFEGGWIFDSTTHLMKKGFVNDFMNKSAFA
jgi:hypothetical protein